MLLVLLPGMDGTGDLFGPLLRVMPETVPRRIISYPTETFLTYAELLTLLERQLADENGLVLIGESYSGALALAFAAAHPQRVRAVILSAAFVLPPCPSWLRWVVRPFWLRLHIPKSVVRFFVSGSQAPDALVCEVLMALRRPSPTVMAKRARDVLTMNATKPLADCQAPILYLAATRDRMVRRSSLRRILEIRPDAQVCKIVGPHLILQTAPKEAWQSIDGFLRSMSP